MIIVLLLVFITKPVSGPYGVILAKAVAMRVMINATGCPAPALDRNRIMKTHKHLSQLIASAIDHDLPTPV